MINFFKKLFGTRPTVSPCPEAPYKVETPEVKQESVADKATEAAVKSVAKPAKKTAPKKQGTTKPRKPKAPKQPKA